MNWKNIWWKITCLLIKVFPYVDIMDHLTGELYLRRIWLLGHMKSNRGALMLHYMAKPDKDRCLHDHPWSFTTMILGGGYLERVDLGDEVGVKWLKVGCVRYRPAEYLHSIELLPKGYATTLVYRRPKSRSWGFVTDNGWIHWSDYLSDGIMWCQEKVFKRKDHE